MSSRNGVRVDSQQLRDIQDLISKLEDVNKQLALPLHAPPVSRNRPVPTHHAMAWNRHRQSVRSACLRYRPYRRRRLTRAKARLAGASGMDTAGRSGARPWQRLHRNRGHARNPGLRPHHVRGARNRCRGRDKCALRICGFCTRRLQAQRVAPIAVRCAYRVALRLARTATNARSALIWFSCFCCASEKRRSMPRFAASERIDSVSAVRHPLSAPI